MPDHNLGKLASKYAMRGWQVFPCYNIVQGPAGPQCSCNSQGCTSPGKHPRTQRGATEATTNQATIFNWWKEWPNANIGVATGSKSGIAVIDLDTKTEGPLHWQELQDIHGPVETLTTITGSGGAHWIFKAPSEGLRSTAGQIAKGIDTRAEGGYIIVPPSNHLSGQTYEWDNRAEISEVPQWLMLLWPKHQVAPPSVNGNGQHTTDPKDYPNWLAKGLAEGAPEGERNSLATRIAGYFRSKGIPRDVVLQLMREYAAKCQPPLELPELQRTIDSAQRYAVQVAEAGVSDPPDFQEHLGMLTYNWRHPGVRIQLEQLHRNKQGTHCEITIDSVGGEREKQIIGPVGYNLTSISGRETLLKALKRRWEIDWEEVLEKLTRMAMAYLRVGEPVRHLRDYMHRPTSAWILNPLILEDQPTILFGTGGLGKSLVALGGMLTLESGAPVLPGLAAESGHRGIYLDWERTGTYEHGTRYRRLLVGVGLEPKELDSIYLPITGSINENVRHIKRTMDMEGVTFAIIDSAGFACGGDPEKAEFALQFFEAVHMLQVPTLIIAHQTKGDSRGMPFGSVFWHNAARSTWEIRNQQVPGENRLKVGLFNRKANLSGLAKPIGFDISFSDGSTTVSRFDPRTNSEMAAGAIGLSDQVAALLEEGPMTVKEIAEATGKTENNIRNVFSRNQDRFAKVATNEGAPLWGLYYAT